MNKKNCYKLLFAICLLLAVVAAMLAGIAISTDYDTKANYFVSHAPLYTAACVVAVVSLITGIVAAICTPTKDLNSMPFSKRNTIPTAAGGFLLVMIAILIQKHSQTIPQILIFLALGATVPAAIYVLLSSFPSQTQKHPTMVAGFGLFSILACLLLNVYLYFDLSVEMNAPLKIFLHLGLLSSMLFYTCELRYLLKTPMPRLFLAVSVATVSLGSLCALSLPVAFLANRFARFDYLACALLVIAVMITAILRTLTLLNPESDSEGDTEPTEEISPEEAPTEEASEQSPIDTQSDSNDEL